MTGIQGYSVSSVPDSIAFGQTVDSGMLSVFSLPGITAVYRKCKSGGGIPQKKCGRPDFDARGG